MTSGADLATAAVPLVWTLLICGAGAIFTLGWAWARIRDEGMTW